MMFYYAMTIDDDTRPEELDEPIGYRLAPDDECVRVLPCDLPEPEGDEP